MLFGFLSLRFIAFAALAFVAICAVFLFGPLQEWRERRAARQRAVENRELAQQWEATVGSQDEDGTPGKPD